MCFKGSIPNLDLWLPSSVILMQLGHNSSQASISWCPGSPWGQSGHNGPIICMPTRKAQSSQCSVCLIVVSSPGNVGLQQTQHTAVLVLVLVLVLDYSSAVCALIVEHQPLSCSRAISPLALGNLHTHTPSPSSSIPQHSNVKSFTASPPINICWRKPCDEIFYSFPTTSLLCWLNWPSADQMSQVRIWSFYTLELWSFRGQSGANNSLCDGSFSIPFSCLISAPKRHNHNSVLRLFLLTFW